MKIALVASHPIQYLTPLLVELARKSDLIVYYAHRPKPRDHAVTGFQVPFEWDNDVLRGHRYEFLENRSRSPGIMEFKGCDTPGIGAALDRSQPDVVITLGWHMKCYLQAAWAARRRGVPVFARTDSHLHTPTTPAKKNLKRVVYPLFLRLFSGFLPAGTWAREFLLTHWVKPERCILTPHVVDTEAFSPRQDNRRRNEQRQEMDIEPSKLVLLFVGRFLSCKRPVHMLEAAARVRNATLENEVVMVGSGPMEDDIRRYAKVNCLSLHMPGFINQSKLVDWYRMSDLLILPSISETWGIVVNEAFACGVPAVVSDAVGCAPDMIEQGETGDTFYADDSYDLARNLAGFVPRLGTPRVASALRRRVQTFTPDPVADRLVEGLARALHRRRSGRRGTG